MFKKIPVIVSVVAILALVSGADSPQAMENPKVFRGVLLLEGKIATGDYEKLLTFLRDKATFDKISGGVFIASPGGSVVEAINIGRLIRALGLSTSAPSGPRESQQVAQGVIAADDLADQRNFGCASACFLVFVSGVYRDVRQAGRLGVHKPFRLQSDMKTPVSGEDPVVDSSVRRLIENYLGEMGVPARYGELMFAVPSNRIRWISQRELHADLDGLVPELKKVVDSKCAGSAQGRLAADKRIADSCQADVEWRIRAELPAEQWPKVFGHP